MSLHTVFLISGILALVVSLITYAVKEKIQILHCRLVTDTLWIICYLCEGTFAFTGAANSATCLIRDTIFCFKAKGKRWASHTIWCVIFCLFYAAMLLYAWTGPLSIFTALSSIISTIALFTKNVHLTRWLTILCMMVSAVYIISVGNYFNLLANICSIISAIIGLFRDAKTKKAESLQP